MSTKETLVKLWQGIDRLHRMRPAMKEADAILVQIDELKENDNLEEADGD